MEAFMPPAQTGRRMPADEAAKLIDWFESRSRKATVRQTEKATGH
jgi:hypothetical protein